MNSNPDQIPNEHSSHPNLSPEDPRRTSTPGRLDPDAVYIASSISNENFVKLDNGSEEAAWF